MLVCTHTYMSIFETMSEEVNITLANYEARLQFLLITPISTWYPLNHNNIISFLHWNAFSTNIPKCFNVFECCVVKSSINLDIFGLLQWYLLMYIFRNSIKRGHSNKKWYSASKALHILHFLWLYGILFGLSHLPTSAYKLCEDNRNLLKLFPILFYI